MKKTYKKSDYKHKQWFKAKIAGGDCIGRVSIDPDGDIYLCQNNINGVSANDKLGFNCSWVIDNGSTNDLKTYYVEDLVLLSRKPAPIKTPFVPIIPSINGYNKVIIKDDGESIQVGCIPVSRKLYLKIGRLVGWVE